MDISSLFLTDCSSFYHLLFQFPAVNHPQTLERRYLGIIGGGLLDLLKVGITGLEKQEMLLSEGDAYFYLSFFSFTYYQTIS